MNVAVVTSLYPASGWPGEGMFAERRWTAFAARGHVVRGERARFRAMPRCEERAGLRIERPRYPHVPGAGLLSARAFAGAARRSVLSAEPRSEVVVADYAWPAATCGGWARAHGRAFVVSGRGSDVLAVRETPRLASVLAAELERADARVAVSRDLARAMDELAGAGATRLVPNGVDQDLFRPRERAAARAELGLPTDGALVLVVGHLIERKDPLLALQAFAAGAPPAARLAFIGEGPLGAEVDARARAAGLRDRVVRRERASASELASWYAAADVLLLTSHREGRPNVVLEALSCGRPVLATDSGGTKELLVELPECLAATREPGEIGARLAALLRSPPSAERCRAAVAGLTWGASAEALERVLEEALARRATREAP